jgi:hypothetical protein
MGLVPGFFSIVIFTCFALLRCTRLLHLTPPPASMPLLDLFHSLPLLLPPCKPKKAFYVFIVVYLHYVCVEIIVVIHLRSHKCSKLYSNVSLHLYYLVFLESFSFGVHIHAITIIICGQALYSVCDTAIATAASTAVRM